MSPVGIEDGRIAASLLWLIAGFVDENQLGTGAVYAEETGFLLTRNLVVVPKPDLAFVCHWRDV